MQWTDPVTGYSDESFDEQEGAIAIRTAEAEQQRAVKAQQGVQEDHEQEQQEQPVDGHGLEQGDGGDVRWDWYGIGS